MDCLRRFLLRFPWMFPEDLEANTQTPQPQRSNPVDMGQQNPPAGGSRKISFNVSDQYEIQDVIGEGAYGVVW
jgi:hypothetical protein